MPPVTRPDTYPSYNFQVIVTGVSNDGKAVSGSFSEVSGLEVEVPPILYRNGSEDITQRSFPGLQYADITFKRGITGDVDFWKWIVRRLTARCSAGAIVLLDEIATR
jgi:phage tail-like protein